MTSAKAEIQTRKKVRKKSLKVQKTYVSVTGFPEIQ